MRSNQGKGTVSVRIFKQGNSLYSLWPKPFAAEVEFGEGSLLVLRNAGLKVIVERVPEEKLAILRTGEIGRSV